MLRRIVKTLAALGAGHGVQTLSQLLLPPAFIAAYGIEGYGEWLALSAAVGYLGTLDFGLQTYVLNRLTALYHRGEFEEFHRVQSVGLSMSPTASGIAVLWSFEQQIVSDCSGPASDIDGRRAWCDRLVNCSVTTNFRAGFSRLNAGVENEPKYWRQYGTGEISQPGK